MAILLQVLAFAGELLSNAESLLRDGLHTSEVADGYSKAAAKASHPDFAWRTHTSPYRLLQQEYV